MKIKKIAIFTVFILTIFINKGEIKYVILFVSDQCFLEDIFVNVEPEKYNCIA